MALITSNTTAGGGTAPKKKPGVFDTFFSAIDEWDEGGGDWRKVGDIFNAVHSVGGSISGDTLMKVNKLQNENLGIGDNDLTMTNGRVKSGVSSTGGDGSATDTSGASATAVIGDGTQQPGLGGGGGGTQQPGGGDGTQQPGLGGGAYVIKNETTNRGGRNILIETLSDGTTRERDNGPAVDIAAPVGGVDLGQNPTAAAQGDVNQDELNRFTQSFQTDFDKSIASGNYDPESLGGGFRASGGGSNAATNQAIRDALAGFSGRLTSRATSESANLGGQQERPAGSTRDDFLTDLINRDNDLQANQQQVVSNMVSAANQAGDDTISGLNLPDSSQISPLEQALQDKLMARVNSDDLLNIDDSLAVAAEEKAKTRLGQDNFLSGIDDDLATMSQRVAMKNLQGALGANGLLGAGSGLSEAMGVARKRLTQEGDYIDATGQDYMTSAEQVLLDRLKGGTNPMIEAQRAEYLAQADKDEAQLRENLNRMGVLRSGDSAEVLGDFYGQRGRGVNDINSLGYQMQSQALADALGFQGRRDNLALANQDLRRASINDVAGLQGQMDSRTALEQQLRSGAIGDAMGIQGRTDNLALANQDLQRAAISDALALQGRRDTIGMAEQDLQRAALGDGLNYQGMRDNRDLAQAGQRMDAQRLGQDISDRELNRSLTQTAPTQRELFAESVRQNQIGNVLAQGNDLRAGQASDRAGMALESDLFGQVQQGANRAPTRTLSGQQFDLSKALSEAGLTGQYNGADTMAREGFDLSKALSEAGLTGQYDGADTMARESLDDQLTGSDLQRRLAEAGVTGLFDTGAANQAPIQTQAARMDAFNRLMAGNADTRAGNADTRAGDALEDQLLSSDLQRRLAEAGVTGLYDTGAANQPLAKTQSARMDEFNRLLAGNADTRSERALLDALFGEIDGQRTESGLTNDINRTNATNADRRAGNADNRARLTLEDILFGQVQENANGPARTTLGGQEADRRDRGFEDDLLTAILGRDATRAGLTGNFEDGRTLAGSQVDNNMSNERIVQLIAAADAGMIPFGTARSAILESFGLPGGQDDPPPSEEPAPPPGTTPQPDGSVINAAGERLVFYDGEWINLG